jgi:hypothetical protein
MIDATSTWHLECGQAITLEAAAQARRLAVDVGRLWITADGSDVEPAKDQWLSAGQVQDIPAGASLVIEAWPKAAFQLLVPPQPAATPATAGSSRPLARRSGFLRWSAFRGGDFALARSF